MPILTLALFACFFGLAGFGYDFFWIAILALPLAILLWLAWVLIGLSFYGIAWIIDQTKKVSIVLFVILSPIWLICQLLGMFFLLLSLHTIE